MKYWNISNKTRNLETRGWRRPLCALLLLGSLAQAPAATQVSGHIISETWTKARSPYLMIGDIVVASLTIQPGVQILAQGNYVFQVDGILTALGTESEMIVFTRTSGPWQGILFNGCYDSTTLRYCVVSNSVNSGIRISECGPLLDYCWIQNNTTPGWAGGGVHAISSTGTIRIKDCVVSGNVVNPSKAVADSYGGGLFIQGNADLLRTRILNNACYAKAGSICHAGGAGVMLHFAQARVRNCEIRGNYAHADGTAPYNWRKAKAWGGGLMFKGGSLLLENSILASNTVWAAANDTHEQHGGGLYAVESGSCRVVNSVIAYNNEEGVYALTGPSVGVTNSIVYWNGGQEIAGLVSVAYSDVEGGYTGVGNINCNPLFGPAWRIQVPSCCIDAGSPDPTYDDVCFQPSYGPQQGYTVRNDIGAHGGPGACNWIDCLPPAIVVQPSGRSICLGQSATLGVTASGTPPLSYQWLKDNDLMPGETAPTLTLATQRSEDAGVYSVVVSNACGSVTSAPAPLLVYDACIDLRLYSGLAISGQPGSTYVLSCSTDLGSTWLPLATNVMGGSNWFYLDLDSPHQPRRFYKATLLP